MTDSIDHPSHYAQKVLGREPIDVAQWQKFCTGNVIKYLWRYPYKGKPLEDLQKARWYARRAAADRETVETRFGDCDGLLFNLARSSTGFESVAWKGLYESDWQMVIEALDQMIERLEEGE